MIQMIWDKNMDIKLDGVEHEAGQYVLVEIEGRISIVERGFFKETLGRAAEEGEIWAAVGADEGEALKAAMAMGG